MKHRIISAVALCCAVLLAGCTAAPQEETPAGPAMRHDFAAANDLSDCTYEDAWDTKSDYIVAWAQYAYQEFGVTEAEAICTGGAIAEDNFGEILAGSCLGTNTFELALTAEQPIPDTMQDEQGRYLLTAITVAVGEDSGGSLTLVGVLEPGSFGECDMLDAIYTLLGQDERYADALVPRETKAMPQGAQSAVIYQLLPEGVQLIRRDTCYLEDGTAVLACARPVSSTEAMAGILFWRGGEANYVETEMKLSIPDYYENGYWQEGKFLSVDGGGCEAKGDHAALCLFQSTEGTEYVMRLVDVYPDGAIKDYGEGDFRIQYYECDVASPDGSRTVRHLNGSILDVTGGQERMLLDNGIHDREPNMKELTYVFQGWLDNDRFLYALSYGWVAFDYHVYDLRTDTAAELPLDDRYVLRDGYNGKLLMCPNAMMGDADLLRTVVSCDPDTGALTPLPGIPEGWQGYYTQLLGDTLYGYNDIYEGSEITFQSYDLTTGEVKDLLSVPQGCYPSRGEQCIVWDDYGTAFTPAALYYLPD